MADRYAALLAESLADDVESIAPGSLVSVRDETRLGASIEDSAEGNYPAVGGVDDLVDRAIATCWWALDTIRALRTEEAEPIADYSSWFRSTWLWFESVLRKGSVSVDHSNLTITPKMPADAVVLGKTRAICGIHVDLAWLSARVGWVTDSLDGKSATLRLRQETQLSDPHPKMFSKWRS